MFFKAETHSPRQEELRQNINATSFVREHKFENERQKGTVCFFERLKLAVSRLTLPDDLQLFDSQHRTSPAFLYVG